MPLLRRDCCCCICYLQGHTWHSRGSQLSAAVGSMFGAVSSQSRQWMWFLTFTLGPSPKHFPQFVLLLQAQGSPCGWVLHSWSAIISLVSLGEHVGGGDYLPFRAAIKTTFIYCCLCFWLNQLRGNELKHLLNFTSLLSHSKQRTERQHHFSLILWNETWIVGGYKRRNSLLPYKKCQSGASLVAALRSALDVLAPLESSIFLHLSSIIPGMGMILLLMCRTAVMSGSTSIQRTSVLLCLEEIHAGRDSSVKLGMLYIISSFPQKSKL